MSERVARAYIHESDDCTCSYNIECRKHLKSTRESFNWALGILIVTEKDYV